MALSFLEALETLTDVPPLATDSPVLSAPSTQCTDEVVHGNPWGAETTNHDRVRLASASARLLLSGPSTEDIVRRGRRGPKVRHRATKSSPDLGKIDPEPIVLRVICDPITCPYDRKASPISLCAKGTVLLHHQTEKKRDCLLSSRIKCKRWCSEDDNEIFVPRSLVEAEELSNASVVHVLNTQRGRQYLRMHLEKESSTECIDFWEDTAHIPKLRCKELLYPAVRNVVQTYIKDQCKYPVNVCAKTREKILADYKSGRISPRIFDTARNDIFKLIKLDPFRRFQKSKYYKMMVSGADLFVSSPIVSHEGCTPIGSGRSSVDTREGVRAGKPSVLSRMNSSFKNVRNLFRTRSKVDFPPQVVSVMHQ